MLTKLQVWPGYGKRPGRRRKKKWPLRQFDYFKYPKKCEGSGKGDAYYLTLPNLTQKEVKRPPSQPPFASPFPLPSHFFWYLK